MWVTIVRMENEA